jgi:hypothetical protein
MKILSIVSISLLGLNLAFGSAKITDSWPEDSRKAFTDMQSEYGPPDEITASMAIWNNNGVWKRTIVHRDPVPHDFPMPHKDVLEQFINMRVPADKFDELAAYDGSVIVERTKGEISARCDKEGANFLALNLARDIVDGKTTVEDAKKRYAEHIMAMKAGKQTDYVKGLRFNVASGDTGDRDKSIR